MVRERCPRSGKVKFGSRAAAERRLEEIARMPVTDAVADHFYRPTHVAPRCRSCGFFHLSSTGTTKPHGRGTAARLVPKRRGKARRKK
ncbi:hypothetical protein [Actinophytocola sp.]|uniref:hypothetical protein n=1 Tax=Actinophytocola sp. TaxID=1872138 RepID=UPI002D7E4A08|nr:hypothetical protein [Actinophytocola sp.]HET9144041.1 hypothetical protein [Actinophytocola sp.]